MESKYLTQSANYATTPLPIHSLGVAGHMWRPYFCCCRFEQLFFFCAWFRIERRRGQLSGTPHLAPMWEGKKQERPPPRRVRVCLSSVAWHSSCSSGDVGSGGAFFGMLLCLCVDVSFWQACVHVVKRDTARTGRIPLKQTDSPFLVLGQVDSALVNATGTTLENKDGGQKAVINNTMDSLSET